MTLQLIEKHHYFDQPGTLSNQKADVKGTIIDNQATVVLRGIEPSFEPSDHELELFKVMLSNIKVRETYVEYDLEFNFKDSSSNLGTANIDVLVIADVKSS